MPKTVFTDGDKSLGLPGTRLLSAFLNKIFAHRHDGLDQDGSAPLEYAVDSGVADAYVIALTPALTTSIAGLAIHFKAAASNTGPSTLKVDALPLIPIKKGYSFDLEKGDIVAGQIITVLFDGVNFQLLSTPRFAKGGVNSVTALVFNNAVDYQMLPGIAVTETFTGKNLKISLCVQGKNTGTVAHPLQLGIYIGGAPYLGFEAGPNTAGDGQWRLSSFDVFHQGLSGNTTIQAACKVDAGAGTQITINKASLVVHELP